MRREVVEDARFRSDSEPGGLRRDARRNRLGVLRAAREVFRERGLEATVRNVAHRAGVSTATVHRRFSGRDAIVADLAEQVAGEWDERWEALARGFPAEVALERALRLVASETVATRACSPDHRELFPERARELEERVHRGLYRLLADARETGGISAAVGAEDLRLVMISVAAVVAVESDEERAERAAQRVVTHFLRSFRGTG
ncbi:helix-turn-helix domain-containing protein [Nocardiopsis alba]|uniref:TetR/AcrR family transcriptional regulator n=1 Tax=Nocardiopsis alba TaxID=53437 RepID=UPI0030B84B30